MRQGRMFVMHIPWEKQATSIETPSDSTEDHSKRHFDDHAYVELKVFAELPYQEDSNTELDPSVAHLLFG